MIINDNTERKPVEFQELEIGDLFEYDNHTYLLIYSVDSDNSLACCLDTHTLLNLGPEVEVVKRNGYLVLT